MSTRQLPSWFPRAVAAVIVAIVLTWAAVGLVQQLQPLLLTVGVCLLLASALEQPVDALARRGMRRGVATFLVLTAVGGMLLGALVLIAVTVVGQVTTLTNDVPRIVDELAAEVTKWSGQPVDAAAILDYLQRPGGGYDTLTANLATTGRDALPVIGYVLTGLLVLFYLVADGPRLRAWVCSLLPARRQAEVLRGWDVAVEKAGGWLLLRGVLIVVSTVVHLVIFWPLGVPYAAAMALWVGIVSQAIPVVGTYLAGALPVLLALTVSPGLAVAVLIVLVVYQQVENYLLAPRIARSTMQIHPAVGLLSVIAAALLIGPVGALVATPVVATISAFASVYLHRHDVIDHPSLPTIEPADDVVVAAGTERWQGVQVADPRRSGERDEVDTVNDESDTSTSRPLDADQ